MLLDIIIGAAIFLIGFFAVRRDTERCNNDHR